MIVAIVLLLSIICVTIGVTYAAFTFTKEGSVENTLETSTIMLTYTEGKTGILLNEAYPMSDEKGKILTGENNVISYEVSATKIPIVDVTPLLDNEVKLYLERAIDPDATYLEIHFVPLHEASEVGTLSGSMVLDEAIFFHQGVTIHNYRLRMWVDENAQIPNGESRKYGIKINVYAKQGQVEIEEEPTPTDESYFVFNKETKAITNYAIDSDGNEMPNAPVDVVIPKTIQGVLVEAIGNFAFNDKHLMNIFVPEGVSTIGNGAFATNQLTKIELPHTLTTIGNSAFVENYNLSYLTLGQGTLEKDEIYIQ